jgi:PAB1-binding protein PBP1
VQVSAASVIPAQCKAGDQYPPPVPAEKGMPPIFSVKLPSQVPNAMPSPMMPMLLVRRSGSDLPMRLSSGSEVRRPSAVAS